MTKGFYKKIIDESPVGYAYHKIICDEAGTPIDYVYIEVNAAFEKSVGLLAKDIVGKHATEIFPNMKKYDFDWIKVYGDVALNEKKCNFNAYADPLKEWYKVFAYAPEKGYFVSIFQKISDLIEEKDKILEIVKRYRSIFEYAPIGITNTSMESNFLEVNGKFCEMVGYSRKELYSMNFYDITHDEDRTVNKEGTFKMEAGTIPVLHIEKRYIHKNGSIVWVNISSTLVRDADGAPLYFINMISDISAQKEKEKDRLYMDSLIKEMGRIAKIGAWEFDVKSKKGAWTEEIANIHDLDLSPNQLKNITMSVDYYSPESQRTLLAARKDAIEQGIPYSLELEFISAKGIKKWVRTIGTPTFENGKVVSLHGAFQDITERKEAELALRKSELKYRLIAENTVDVISIYNKTKNEFVYVSPSVERLRGISAAEAMKESIEDSVKHESLEFFSNAIEKNLDDFLHNPSATNSYVNEVQQLCKDGGGVWVEISTKYQYNTDGDVEAVSIIRNIEERKKAEQAMIDLSYRDQLTGLYNRRFYEEELKRMDTEKNFPLALVMADVNELKYVNDTFRHHEGDLLLQRFATILKEACRSDDVVSRIGGDEFVIFLPKTGPRDVQQLINRIHAAVSEESEKNSGCSLSIGFAVKEDRQESIFQTFKKAEDEMYRHKFAEGSTKRNRCRL